MDLLNYISQKNDKKDIKIKDNNIYPKPYPISTPKIKDDLKDIKIINIKNPIIKELDKIPNKIDPYKIQDVDIKKYNFLIFGSNDPIFNNHRINKSIDNKYLYGDPSPKELMISNYQTDQGTSNNLQTKLLQVKTGESIDDINDANDTIDNVYKTEIDRLMNKLDKENEKISLRIQPDHIKEIKKEVAKEDTMNDIERVQRMTKRIKANIKPVIQSAIYNDDQKEKLKEKQENENKSANKIQNFVKSMKAKKEGKELIKNIVDDINKGLRHQDLQNETNKKIKQLKEDKEQHKEKLNKVFKEAAKSNKNDNISENKQNKREKKINYNKIYKLKNLINQSNPMIEAKAEVLEKPLEAKIIEEPPKRKRGRPKKIDQAIK